MLSEISGASATKDDHTFEEGTQIERMPPPSLSPSFGFDFLLPPPPPPSWPVLTPKEPEEELINRTR